MHPEHRGRGRDAGAGRATRRRSTLPERFLLFVGKLEENKGARLLVPAVAAARTGLPLVVLGEGSLAHALKFDAAAAGVTAACCAAGPQREDVLRALARATALVFPSLWPEPLSRVLLEALALGTPIAAMDTGGTARDPRRTAERAAGRATRRGWARRWRRLVGDDGAARDAWREGGRARAARLRARGAGAALRGGVPEARREGGAAQPRRRIRSTRRAAWSARSSTSRGTCRRGAWRRCSSRGPPTRAGRVPRRGGDRALRRPGARHGRVLDRTLRYPRFAQRLGAAVARARARGRGGRGGRAGPDARSATAALRARGPRRCARRWS